MCHKEIETVDKRMFLSQFRILGRIFKDPKFGLHDLKKKIL